MTAVANLNDVRALEAAWPPPSLASSTYELIRRGAAIDPQAPALSFFLRASDHATPERFTYSELLAHIHQAANLFHSLGVQRDNVVSFVLPNLPETHFTIWGAEATGIVAAINPLLEPSAIARLLTAAETTVLVTLAPFPGTDLWSKLHPVLAQVPTLRHVVLVNLADRVHGVRGLAARALQARESLRLHKIAGVRGALPRTIELHDFGRSLARMPADRLRSTRKIDPQDYSSMFCTGGTTGTPKLAMRRHAHEVANVWSAAQFMGDGLAPGKNIFCGLPLFHVNGVLVTGLLPFAQGAHVVLGTPQGYRGDGVIPRFWEIVEHHQIHFFSGVPTLYAALLEVPIAGHKIDSLEFGLCGAAPMPMEVFRKFQERTGLKILEGYGLTEATCVSTVNPPDGERRLGSIGLRIPAQAIKTVIVDEAGTYERDCQIDEIGILTISGPNVFSGYKVTEHNRGLWLDLGDGKKWLNTGDLGRQDAAGYFWLTGRKKELIIRGGHNLDPASIEDPLHRHPAVQLAAAIGRPDAHAGELPVAYVQLHPGASATEAELITFAQMQIPERAAWPKRINIVLEIPLTAVGKIFKPALKQREVQDALLEALRAAQVEPRSLEARQDDTHGLVVHVALTRASDDANARRVLGQFPFVFKLETPA